MPRKAPRKKPLPPSRAMALETLRLVLDGDPCLDVQPALDRVLSVHEPCSADAGLTTELAYGVLRHKGRLEAVVRSFLRSASDTPPGLLRILVVAAHELLHLDRVPAYATLDWAVSRAAKRYGAAMGKVANAVLRNIDRTSDELTELSWYEQQFSDGNEALAAFYSAPVWLVRLWQDSYGTEAARAYLAASLQPPPVGVRVNRLRPDAGELCDVLDAVSTYRDGCSFTLLPKGVPSARLRELVAEGRATRQSFASQQVLAALSPESWPQPVWDACAGRGGKTTHLLERGVRVAVSSDVHRTRLAGLARELDRLGLTDNRPAVVLASAAEVPPLRTAPGTILLDVPCSGLGVLSRRPEAKWRRTEQDIDQLARLQRAMLDAALRSVASGGCVAYITCTLNPRENQLAVQDALSANPGVVLLSEYHTPTPHLPDVFPGEFFYGALLRVPETP